MTDPLRVRHTPPQPRRQRLLFSLIVVATLLTLAGGVCGALLGTPTRMIPGAILIVLFPWTLARYRRGDL